MSLNARRVASIRSRVAKYTVKSTLYSLLTLSTVGALAACGSSSSNSSTNSSSSTSSTSTSSDGGGGSTTSGTSNGGAAGDGGSTSSSTASTGTSPPNTCDTAADCGTCCQTQNPAGTDKLIGLLVTQCGCQAGSTCYSVCNGVMDATCSGDPQNPGADCGACVNQADQNSDACVTPAVEQCNADTNCAALLDCIATCPN